MSANQIQKVVSPNESIEEYLKSVGFIKDDQNEPVRFNKEVPGQVRTININGQVITQQEPPSKLTILYYGEGSVDDDPIYGYQVLQNDNPVSDVEYVDSLESFQQLFG